MKAFETRMKRGVMSLLMIIAIRSGNVNAQQDSASRASCPVPTLLQNIFYNAANDTLQLMTEPSIPGSYSYSWSPSSYFSDPNVQNPIFSSPNYDDTSIVTVTLYNSIPGCPSGTNSLTIYTLKAHGGNDTTICNAPYNSFQLNPGINWTDSNSYVYYTWTPSTGLSDPFSRNPFVNNVTDQQYILYVYIDAPVFTLFSDTVNITVHNPIIDTGYYCPGGAPLTLGTVNFGGGDFLWNTGDTTDVITVNSAGIYNCASTYLNPSCVTNSQFTIIDSCLALTNVWPGDANNDLIVNNYDVLNLGLAFGDTGTVRPSVTTYWIGQPMSDWPQFYNTGVNYKHGDCNGNGIINLGDDTVINNNYNYSHPPFMQAHNNMSRSTADLYLVAQYDTVGLMATVNFAVMLGNTGIPIDSIYGIAYSLSYDADLTYQPLTVIYDSSWFGNPSTNVFSFAKAFHNDGYTDLAVTRKDHANASGNGQIGNAIIVTTDNVAGIYSTLHVGIYDVRAVTSSGSIINLSVAGDSVIIFSPTFGVSEFDQRSSVSVYPNPNNGIVNINSPNIIEQITVFNTLGYPLYNEKTSLMQTAIDLSKFNNGIYYVSVRTKNGTINKRITINK